MTQVHPLSVLAERKKPRVRKLPAWTRRLLKPKRYKGIKGGRGGGKSHGVFELQLLLQAKYPNRRMVCLREVQKSLKESVKQLLETKIRDLGLQKYFKILSTEIRSVRGDGVIMFQGLADHTAVTIKSLEGVDVAVVEEAQTISKRSIGLLRPTIREEGSEIWFLWNPLHRSDPVDEFFFGPKRPEEDEGELPRVMDEDTMMVVEVNYRQNKYASKTMLADAAYDLKDDPEKHAHVWDGGYEEHSEARIFKKLKIYDFDTPRSAIIRFGADWGFSVDPLVLLGVYIIGRDLFIDREAWRIGCEIDDTPGLFMTVPDAEKWWITAGGERPERISYLQRRGWKIKKALRGNFSEQRGVDHLQNYTIHIHKTNCPHAAKEFQNYKHPIDKLTDRPLPILPTKKNHTVEAARYATEDVRRFEEQKIEEGTVEDNGPLPIVHGWNN